MFANLSDGARRALRTGYQALLACLTLIPAWYAILPADSPAAAKFAGVIAAVAAMSAMVNKAEDRGLIPAWLK